MQSLLILDSLLGRIGSDLGVLDPEQDQQFRQHHRGLHPSVRVIRVTAEIDKENMVEPSGRRCRGGGLPHQRRLSHPRGSAHHDNAAARVTVRARQQISDPRQFGLSADERRGFDHQCGQWEDGCGGLQFGQAIDDHLIDAVGGHTTVGRVDVDIPGSTVGVGPAPLHLLGQDPLRFPRLRVSPTCTSPM